MVAQAAQLAEKELATMGAISQAQSLGLCTEEEGQQRAKSCSGDALEKSGNDTKNRRQWAVRQSLTRTNTIRNHPVITGFRLPQLRG